MVACPDGTGELDLRADRPSTTPGETTASTVPPDRQYRSGGCFPDGLGRHRITVRDSELAAAAAGIERFHREERAAHERQAPAATEILSSTQSDPERWRSEHGSSLRVRIGRGRIRSGLEVVDHAGGRPPDGAGPGEDAVEAALSALAAQAADLADAPVVVDAELGIGICGPRAPATAMVRALIVQLAHGCSPASTASMMRSATTCRARGRWSAVPRRWPPG